MILHKIRQHALVGVGLCWLILDLITKTTALKMLPYQEAVPVLPFFNLSLRFNTGIAFSFFANHSEMMPWLLTAIAIITSIIFAIWYSRLDSKQYAERLGLILIISGAMGNVIDRLYYGHVIDFLEFYIKDYYWPAFNIADSGICIGAGLIIYSTIRSTHDKR